MPFLEWTQKFSVGVDIVDEQHQELFGILNRLYDSVVEGKEQSELADILEELVSYTVYHFKTEEDLHAKHDYPGRAMHRAEHDKLTGQAVDFQTQLRGGCATISFELLDFLHAWLTGHTTSLDKEFGDFLNEDKD